MGKKRAGSQPNPSDPPVPLTPEITSIIEMRRRVAEAFYQRIVVILEHTIKLWEDKILNDPGYQVAPNDVVGIIQMLSKTEELLFTYSHLHDYVGKAREELKRLEGTLLSLLTSGPTK